MEGVISIIMQFCWIYLQSRREEQGCFALLKHAKHFVERSSSSRDGRAIKRAVMKLTGYRPSCNIFDPFSAAVSPIGKEMVSCLSADALWQDRGIEYEAQASIFSRPSTAKGLGHSWASQHTYNADKRDLPSPFVFAAAIALLSLEAVFFCLLRFLTPCQTPRPSVSLRMIHPLRPSSWPLFKKRRVFQ